ncbi:MAG: hypothetical protein SCALA702_22680 [Melioribacteraceae bacterium]|nr:MAG: hypothetical protein SCALA702_22680 [Melioribacteraceae bacterium]
MKLRMKYTGIFVSFFVGISIIAITAAFILLSMDKRFFSEKFVYNVKFKDAVGLSSSTKVVFKGYDIGRVKEFKLDEFNEINTQIYIYEEFKDKIVENSALNKILNPITGTSSIEFLSGPPCGETLAAGSYLPTLDSPEGEQLVIANLIEPSSELLFSMISNLNTILIDLNKREIRDERVFYTLVKNIVQLTEDVRPFPKKIDSLLVMLSTDYFGNSGRLKATVDNFNTLLVNLNKLSGSLQKVVPEVDTMFRNYKNPDNLLRRMIDPTGKTIFDPAHSLLNDADTLTRESADLIRFLNENKYEIKLLIRQLNSLGTDLEKTIDALNQNPLITPGIEEDDVHEKTIYKR